MAGRVGSGNGTGNRHKEALEWCGAGTSVDWTPDHPWERTGNQGQARKGNELSGTGIRMGGLAQEQARLQGQGLGMGSAARNWLKVPTFKHTLLHTVAHRR